MQKASCITDELIRTSAVNTSAVSNGKKISNSGGFTVLNISADETLIFGECKGSGSKPYYTSVDFSGDAPVFRCSCPSRQIPCKHALGLMFDYLAGKSFATAEVPEDITRKREKIAKRAEKAANPDTAKSAPKQNKSAATKKLKKQREGLDIAESFVNDILSRGVGTVSMAASEQYRSLAKQLGDYYLPELQQIVYGIISTAQEYAKKPDDELIKCVVAECVRLSSAVRKSRDYIDQKLESGEVLPEDSVLYEQMGGVWKLTQLKEIGLSRKDERLIQLSFTVLDFPERKELVDTAYWLSLDSGEVFVTENIRPYRARKYIKEEDSAFGVYHVKELYLYPGGLNRRVRWEAADSRPAIPEDYAIIVSKAEPTLADAVKKAKNELKNTLSNPTAVMLIPYDSIEYAADGHGVLRDGEESIALTEDAGYPNTLRTLKMVAGGLKSGAMLGAMSYNDQEHRIYLSPISVVTPDGIVRL